MKRSTVAIPVIVAALVFGSSFALGQVAAPVAEGPTEVAIRPILVETIPYFVEIVSTILLTIAGFVAKWAKEKWNIDMEARLKEIEEKHRAAFHSAIYSAVAGAVDRLGVGGLKFDVGSEALAGILRYLRDSVPDALEFLKPDDNVVAQIANAKAVEVQAKAAASQPPAPPAVSPIRTGG